MYIRGRDNSTKLVHCVRFSKSMRKMWKCALCLSFSLTDFCTLFSFLVTCRNSLTIALNSFNICESNWTNRFEFRSFKDIECFFFKYSESKLEQMEIKRRNNAIWFSRLFENAFLCECGGCQSMVFIRFQYDTNVLVFHFTSTIHIKSHFYCIFIRSQEWNGNKKIISANIKWAIHVGFVSFHWHHSIVFVVG